MSVSVLSPQHETTSSEKTGRSPLTETVETQPPAASQGEARADASTSKGDSSQIDQSSPKRFAVPVSSSSSTNNSFDSPSRVSNHRRANSESCVSAPACEFSSKPCYDLRGRRKRAHNYFGGRCFGGRNRSRHKRAKGHHGGLLSMNSGGSGLSGNGPSTSSQLSAIHHAHSGGGTNGGGRRVSGRGGGGPGVARRGGHVKQPKAPNNTSSFLIDDLQKRQGMDSVEDYSNATTGADTHSAAENENSTSHHRPRSYSSMATVGPIDPMMDDSLEDEEDSEFFAEFDSASMERIEGLTREQVNREMLDVERANRRLYDRMDNLETQNHRLRNILVQHGIALANVPTSNPNPLHTISQLTSKSRSSSETEEGGEGESCGVNDESVAEEMSSGKRSRSD